MKRILLLLVFSASLFTAYCQNLKELETIQKGWAKKVITGVKDGNIFSLLTAFNRVWPTEPGTAILTDGENPAAQEDCYQFEIDRPNGYVSAVELGDFGQDLSACVWRRSNGHRLFAVMFRQSVGVFPYSIVLFYDYDKSKRTLTPERHPLTDFRPAYPLGESVDAVSIELPRVGKDVVVSEYIMPWGCSIKHTYKWDGMRPHWYSSTIEHLDKMERIYNDQYELAEQVNFIKYCLHDFDEDHNPELWLFSDNDDYQAIYSIRQENVQMLSSTYYKTQFSFFPDAAAICSSGGCGTGCMRADYVVLKESSPLYRFADQQDWDNTADDMVSTYFKDGVELSKAEGERIMECFKNPVEIEPDKREMTP